MHSALGVDVRYDAWSRGFEARLAEDRDAEVAGDIAASDQEVTLIDVFQSAKGPSTLAQAPAPWAPRRDASRLQQLLGGERSPAAAAACSRQG